MTKNKSELGQNFVIENGKIIKNGEILSPREGIASIPKSRFEKLLPTEKNFNNFEQKLLLICDQDTSLDEPGWTKDNPLYGHCAVVSLLAQDIWGGKLLRASLANVLGYEHFRSHYWNLLPNEIQKDFTRSQFQGSYPQNLIVEERSREYVLSYPETVKRYELLKERFNKLL